MIKAPFVVIEGIDGAGTTTQVARLVRALKARGLAAYETREPSDGPVGMLLRQMLRGRIVAAGGRGAPSVGQMALLFAADRLDHLDAEILPQLERGVCVVSDRYDYSSVAYQSASADDPSIIPWLRSLNRYARRPDLTVVLDVSASVARARRCARGGPAEIFDDDPLQARLSAFYGEIERHFPEDAIVHIDGDGEADVVSQQIAAVVSKQMGGPV